VRIDQLLADGDLNALKTAATELRDKCGESTNAGNSRAADMHARYFLELVSYMASRSSVADHGGREEAQKQAVAALEHAEELPLEAELRMIAYVFLPSPTLAARSWSADTWAAMRQRNARYCLHAYKRLHDAIDPTWDPAVVDFRVYAPLPPGRSGLLTPGALDPRDIEDPDTRAQYEESIRENTRKAERYMYQRRLRQLREEWLPFIEHMLTWTYITRPGAAPELESLLDQYVSDIAERAKILTAVQTETLLPAHKPRPPTQPAVPPASQPSPAPTGPQP
jgi:hypothetical protein